MHPDDSLQHYGAAAAEATTALAELVRRTQEPVWRLCSVLGSAGEVEDLVQETYLRAFSSIGSYRGDAPVQLWLFTIARRVCADHVRRRQRQRRILDRVKQHTRDRFAPGPDVVDDLFDQPRRPP
ncbi:MAG: sigma-70 family RNA polymerase sigma factor [Ilumatobacteraceae bacterium]